MSDIESLFSQACEAVSAGNERRMAEYKKNPENIIAHAMLKKAAHDISSDDGQTVMQAAKLISEYIKIKKE